ncbi:hypothetical protein [Rhizobium laguerreae]|uniref:hypothetical protein n=1 Tax=Rhizobium laguerreae TaxID=1076926 RepID=UPI001C90B524|nr:hypothetical protein [Rhizobium laguerreae]MBY3112098.1 hypothetical protein [Rhizobium laguerreae]
MQPLRCCPRYKDPRRDQHRKHTVQSLENAVAGWFAGLIYYGWKAKDTAAALPMWEYAVVAIVGMFIVSIIIGTILTALAAGVTRVATGQAAGSPNAYAWAAFAAPILAFFTAG